MKTLILMLSGLFLSISITYAQNNKYLVAYWSFDDSTAKDQSGHGFDGTIMNTPKPVPGRNGIGTAFYFTGRGENEVTGDHILLPRIPFEQYNEFTITMWVKLDGFSYWHGEAYIWFGNFLEGWMGIFNEFNQAENSPELVISFTSGCQSYDNRIYETYDTSLNKKWVFYSMVYKNQILSAYIDSRLIGQKLIPLKIKSSDGALARHWWGVNNSISSTRFIGTIDEVKIFSRALTDTEIVDEYKTFKITANKTKLCDGDSLILSAEAGFDSYLWSTGETGRNITIFRSGNYSVLAKLNNNTYKADFTVTVFPKPKPVISIKQLPCNGLDGILSIGNGYKTILWSTGSTDSITIVKNFGEFSVVVVDTNGCTGTARIVVNNNSVSKLTLTSDSNKLFCEGDTITLITDKGYSDYEWHEINSNEKINTEKLNYLKIIRPGKYYVVAKTIENCMAISDTITVNFNFSSNVLTCENISDFGYLNFDTTSINQLQCKALLIYNTSANDFNIKNIHLKKNICFSIPQSQFDLIIKGNGKKELVVCCNPQNTGYSLDTLEISDLCVPHRIPVKVFGIPNTYSSNSNCGMHLIFNGAETKNRVLFTCSIPYPNPASSSIILDYLSNRPLKTDVIPSIYLISLSSERKVFYEYSVKNRIENNEFIKEEGNINIDLSEFEDGFYIMKIVCSDNIYTFPICFFKN